jgi:hypothetical protein
LTQPLFGSQKRKSKSPHGAKTQSFKEKASRQASAAEKANQEEDHTG